MMNPKHRKSLYTFCFLVIDERLNLFDDDDAENVSTKKPELDITTTTEYYQYTLNTIGGIHALNE